MAIFKEKFPVLQELFAKNHTPPAGRGLRKGTIFAGGLSQRWCFMSFQSGPARHRFQYCAMSFPTVFNGPGLAP